MSAAEAAAITVNVLPAAIQRVRHRIPCPMSRTEPVDITRSVPVAAIQRAPYRIRMVRGHRTAPAHTRDPVQSAVTRPRPAIPCPMLKTGAAATTGNAQPAAIQQAQCRIPSLLHGHRTAPAHIKRPVQLVVTLLRPAIPSPQHGVRMQPIIGKHARLQDVGIRIKLRTPGSMSAHRSNALSACTASRFRVQ